MIKILFLAANPSDTARLRLDEEARAIDAAIRQGDYRQQFDIRSHWAVRISDLQELLLRHQPHIVHFCGHGSSAGELILQDDQGNAVTVSGEAIRKLFAVLKDNIQCVVLSACYSDAQAHSIAHHIDCVVGMSDAISDQAALDFATAFYRALGYGRSVQTAFDLGTNEIDLRGLMEQDKPKLIANKVEPAKVFFAIDDVQPKTVVRRTPKLMAPNPPADFVARPTEYNALRDLLLADGNAPVGITAAIRGAGGYGKTTLAQALCHDSAIIEHFPDGIFWVELAQEPGELTGRVLNLVENLIDRRPGSTTLDAATSELIKALGDKKLLLVIDDVWQAVHVTPFLQGGPHCTRLVTTRINTVLPVDAPRISVDAMQRDEATQLLGAGLSDGGKALEKLAVRLGEWPLLLRIINAVLRQWVGLGESLQQAITDVNQALSEEGLGVFQNTASANERHTSVAATINVSLRLLNDRERQYYQQLAIFPEGADIPLATVAQLWHLSPLAAKMICVRLVDLSLLLRFDLNTIRLHDVIRTYLREKQPNLTTLQSAFLDSYKLTHWTALPRDEPYLWDRLAYHLVEAERTEELTALFDDDRWLQVRVAHDGYLYDGYLADLNQSCQQVHATVQQQIEAGEMPTAIASLVHHALIRTSISSLVINYEPELVVRALETGLWSSERALSTAYKGSDIQKRVEMITAVLASHRSNEQQCATARTVALEIALTIGDDARRVQALVALAPHLSDEQRTTALPHALHAAMAIPDAKRRVQALVALAPHLSDEQRTTALPHALHAAMAIPDNARRVQAVAALAPHLSNEQRTTALPHALHAALVIRGEWMQVQAVAALAPHLSDEQRTTALPRALRAALAIWDQEARAQAIATLAPHLSSDLLLSALRAALAIWYEQAQVQAVAALTPHLSEEQRIAALPHALHVALAIPDKRAKVLALAALTLHLSEEQRTIALPCALEAAMAIPDAKRRIQALAALAPHLSGEQCTTALARALEAALAIWDQEPRVQALAALTPHLSRDLLQNALEAALVIRDNEAQTQAIAALAPHLSEEQRIAILPHALHAALAIPGEWTQVQALAVLAPHLSEEQRTTALPRALEAALAIWDQEARAQAIAILTPYLSEEQRIAILIQALETSLAIRGEWMQVQALAALAPPLSDEQRTTALPRALRATLALQNKEVQTQILAALAPHLSNDLLLRALDGVLAIWDDEGKIQALAALAPHLSTKLLQNALEGALSIQGGWAQAQALAALAPHLGEEQRIAALPCALQAALVIRDEERRVQALTTLAPHLSDEQRTVALARALEAALIIQDEERRIQALTTLAPHLNNEQGIVVLSHTLEATLAIRDAGRQVQVLAAFLPCLSDSSNLLYRIRKAIANHLWENLPTQQRKDVLWFLANKSIFQLPILDQNILAATAQSISAICFEWRWL